MSGAREQVHFMICCCYSQRRSDATARIVKCKLTSTSWLVSALEFLPLSLSLSRTNHGVLDAGRVAQERRERN